MTIHLTGLKSVYVAKLFATLVSICRLNPLFTNRSSVPQFVEQCLNEGLFLLDYSKEDLKAILSQIIDPDLNGINPVDAFESLSLQKIAFYIKAVFTEMAQINILPLNDLWEGYPLNQALNILVAQNPAFPLKDFLEILSPQDLSPQDLSPQDLSPQDLSPQDLSPQDLSPQDLSPQDLSPQDLSPQDPTANRAL